MGVGVGVTEGGIAPAPRGGLAADQGDGQGCWNELRTQASNTLTAWLNTKPTGTNDNDILIIGDLNAYGKEDPINAITSANYQNLVAQYQGTSAYSYSFGGEIGYLDHALASNDLASQVVDTTIWHINADEPRIFDYNTEFKSPEQLSSYYGEDSYRASDHDPVIVLLNLQCFYLHGLVHILFTGNCMAYFT